MKFTTKTRSPRMRTSIFAIALAAAGLTSCGHDNTEIAEMKANPPPAVVETTTTNSTTQISATRSTTTVPTSTKTTTSTTETTTTTAETEPPTETICIPETRILETTAVETYAETENYLPITESERIMLCNLVGREYGSDYVPTAEKAKVVAVVMNRVISPQFPNTIYEVLTQPYQFSGYIPSDSYTYQVTESVIESVDYYFAHTEEFGNYTFFEGNGTWNYFS